MNKITFFVVLLLCSSYSLALNLSNTYSKETKMSIKTLKDYQTYRLNQLEQLKTQGMDDKTYFREVERVKNLIQLSPPNIIEQSYIDIEDFRSLDKLEITRDFKNIRINFNGQD